MERRGEAWGEEISGEGGCRVDTPLPHASFVKTSTGLLQYYHVVLGVLSLLLVVCKNI